MTSSDNEPGDWDEIRLLLCDLQSRLLETVLDKRNADSSQNMAEIAEVTAADTIYQIDKVSETAIGEWFTDNWPSKWPVSVVMEGVEDDAGLTFPQDANAEDAKWVCVIDPIDGTRNLMYDKRPAWALAGVAPVTGNPPRLADIRVAAMTELPTSRHAVADQLSAVAGNGVVAETIDLRTAKRTPRSISPSTAADCRHGFASISRFFPEGLTLLARVEERLWERLYGLGRIQSPLVFTDQNITSGGQFFELLCGHDRFIADLRPLAFRKLGLKSSLVCHPYDVCAALVAREAGVLIEDPLTGAPLDCPLDTTSPVSWAGYANQTLAAHIRPVLAEVIASELG